MFKKVSLFIALRYLRSKHKSGFVSLTSAFSMLGIMLGVAALIIVMSVMNGYREELSRITKGISGDIIVKSSPYIMSNYQNDLKNLSNEKIISSVHPIIEKQAMFLKNDNVSGIVVRGIDENYIKTKPMIGKNIIEGSIKSFYQDEESVIIGSGLAYSLGLNIGSEVKMVAASNHYTVMGNSPRFKTLRISAIFESGLYFFDNSFVYMNINLAKKVFSTSNGINIIEMDLKPNANLKDAKNVIRNLIDSRYRVEDWQHQNIQLLSALEIERAVMFLILTLIIIVAAFNIISSLHMLVNEKKSDIAILRTFGASKAFILSIFMLTGSIIGILGTISGVIIGVLFSKNIESIRKFLEKITSVNLFDPVIYYLSQLPSQLSVEDVYKVTLLSIILSIAATIFPAIKASSINPAQSLRNE